MKLSERIMDMSSPEKLTLKERNTLAALAMVVLSAELTGLVTIEPDKLIQFRERSGLLGDDDKLIHDHETEAALLAAPVKDDKTSAPYLLYEASVVVDDDRENPKVIVRGVSESRSLEGMYRQLRYGSLLDRAAPLPPEHLVSFEVIPNLPAPTHLVLPARD